MDARCDRCKQCVTCAPAGDHFRGAPHAMLIFFFERAVWSLHRARLVLKDMDWAVPMDELSDIIRKVEEVEDATRGEPPAREPTH